MSQQDVSTRGFNQRSQHEVLTRGFNISRGLRYFEEVQEVSEFKFHLYHIFIQYCTTDSLIKLIPMWNKSIVK